MNDEKLQKILDMQEDGKTNNEIVETLEFPSIQALRSFMNRKGYKSNKGIFIPKEETINVVDDYEKTTKPTSFKASKAETTKEKKNVDKKVKKEKNPNVDKVLDLQIYNLPIFKIAFMIDMTEPEIEKMMTEHGYMKVNDKFVVKPKPLPKSKLTDKSTKSKKYKKVKEKTKAQLLEAEYKKNPAKRGTYDPIHDVWVINVQLIEIIELQLKKYSIGKIAKEMKMTKPALIDFMDEKGYVLENDKFIQRKLAKSKAKQEFEVKNVKKDLKPKVLNPRKENVKFKKDDFADIQKDIQDMYNWYKRIKEHPIFEGIQKR